MQAHSDGEPFHTTRTSRLLLLLLWIYCLDLGLGVGFGILRYHGYGVDARAMLEYMGHASSWVLQVLSMGSILLVTFLVSLRHRSWPFRVSVSSGLVMFVLMGISAVVSVAAPDVSLGSIVIGGHSFKLLPRLISLANMVSRVSLVLGLMALGRRYSAPKANYLGIVVIVCLLVIRIGWEISLVALDHDSLGFLVVVGGVSVVIAFITEFVAMLRLLLLLSRATRHHEAPL